MADLRYVNYDESAFSITPYDDSALRRQIAANETAIATKQDSLVSGENIKTVNGESLLGEGNLSVSDHVTLTQAEYDALTDAEKNNGKVYFITDGSGGGGGGSDEVAIFNVYYREYDDEAQFSFTYDDVRNAILSGKSVFIDLVRAEYEPPYSIFRLPLSSGTMQEGGSSWDDVSTGYTFEATDLWVLSAGIAVVKSWVSVSYEDTTYVHVGWVRTDLYPQSEVNKLTARIEALENRFVDFTDKRLRMTNGSTVEDNIILAKPFNTDVWRLEGGAYSATGDFLGYLEYDSEPLDVNAGMRDEGGYFIVKVLIDNIKTHYPDARGIVLDQVYEIEPDAFVGMTSGALDWMVINGYEDTSPTMPTSLTAESTKDAIGTIYIRDTAEGYASAPWGLTTVVRTDSTAPWA